MGTISDEEITRLIAQEYFRIIDDSIISDVIVVGAGPSGLVAGYTLAQRGVKVVVMEKRLSPGGGVWGGGKGWNIVVLESRVANILEEVGITPVEKSGYLLVSSVLLAAALIKKALETGVTLFNLFAVEDVCFNDRREMAGIVVGDSAYKAAGLPVDPLTFKSKVVIDSTGHEAVVLNCLARRGIIDVKGEDVMNAELGEEAVIDGTREVYPGLIVAGMACAQFHGTCRMGPVFGGMLLSGKKAAELAYAKLGR